MATYGGIDLGGTKIQTIVMRAEDHSAIGQARRLTPHKGGPAAVVDALVACMSEAAAAAGVHVESLDGIGVGAPGEVNAKLGTLANATNLSEWERPFPLAATLSERIGGVAVKLGNDVSVAIDAESEAGRRQGRSFAARSLLGYRGRRWRRSFDGAPWHGRGDAGEIGHMVVKQGGAR